METDIFPIQVLSLQHEDSTPTEWLPYLGVIFSPVQVLEFWGRAAKRDPPCRKDQAVFYWWKERFVNISETMSFVNISVQNFSKFAFPGHWPPLHVRRAPCPRHSLPGGGVRLAALSRSLRVRSQLVGGSRRLRQNVFVGPEI